MPVASILTAVNKKDPNEVDDEVLITADIGERAMRQVKDTDEIHRTRRYG